MEFSLIIPTLNESQKIGADIESASRFLAEYIPNSEILVVDDGSVDQTCERARQAHCYAPVILKVIENSSHHGKGYALRTGFTASHGEWVMFADSGNNVPWNNVLKGLELLRIGKADIAHGSRHLRESEIIIDQNMRRKISSFIFRHLMRWTLAMPKALTDSQCGFKIYRGDIARKLYTQAQSNGFMIDIEIILLALQNDLQICEFPIQWRCDPDTRLSLIKHFSLVFHEWKNIRQRMK